MAKYVVVSAEDLALLIQAVNMKYDSSLREKIRRTVRDYEEILGKIKK